MSALAPFLSAVFPALVVIAALRDATSFTIPNWLCALAVAAFVPVALVCQLPLIGWAWAGGLFAGFLVAGMAMFAMGWIGGGDAKLFAACGLWLGGTAAVWPFLAWTAVAGGGMALALLFARRWAPGFSVRGAPWMARLLTEGESVPYGVAIAVGALMAFPQSPLMQAISHLG
ncbi:prepilin peptidase [soil metagenome]